MVSHRTRRLDCRLLEDRITPTTFFADVAVTDGAPGSLRAAVIAANADSNPDDDTITVVGFGTSSLNTDNAGGVQENAALSGDLDITGAGHKLTIQGASTWGTIIRQSATDRVFHIIPSGPGLSVEFRDLTIRGGRASDDGTANSGTAALGGGVLAAGGTFGLDLTFTRVELSYNSAVSFGTAGEAGFGGGLAVLGTGTTRLTNCNVLNNQATGAPGFAASGAAEGGGIYASSAAVTLNTCLLFGNSVVGGAALHDPATGGSATGGGAALHGSATVTRSNIDNNTAQGGVGGPNLTGRGGDGGDVFGVGLALDQADPGAALLVESTSVAFNHSLGAGAGGPGTSTGAAGAERGSGIYLGQSGGGSTSAQIRTCYVARNSLSTDGDTIGGGLYVTRSAAGGVRLVNVTIALNTAATGGGLGVAEGVSADFTHVTVAANTAHVAGGFEAGSTGTITATNSIFANNIANASQIYDVRGTFTALNNSLLRDTNGTIINSGQSDLFGEDPLLALPADNGGPVRTMALKPGSPAQSRGALTDVIVDARGAARVGLPDLGAYEVIHPLAPVGVPTTLRDLYGPQPSANADESFVKGLYRALLSRDGEPDGVAFWVGQLTTNGLRRSQVVAEFYNSTENRTRQATAFFWQFLGRAPDIEGLPFQVAALQSGLDEAVVMQNFILSPEYTGQSDNATFVKILYFTLLGRAPDAEGLAYWSGQLDTNAQGRPEVYFGLMHSQEGAERFVLGNYGPLLERRVPGVNELSAAVANIQAGGNFGRIPLSLLASDEFYANAAANL